MRPKKSTYAKTDTRHWKSKVFKRRRNGIEDENFTVQIQFRGRREKISLNTPNKEAAAARARDIYLRLQAEGWGAVLEEWKPSHNMVKPTASPTVGDLLSTARELSSIRDSSFKAYSQALRLIVAGIHKLDQDPLKHDVFGGGADRWREKVDKVKLDTITPSDVHAWRVRKLKEAGKDPVSLRKAKSTVNATLRNARALFSKSYLHLLRERLALPDPLPFDGVALEKRQDNRYRSQIDAPGLLAKARVELGREELKAFLLALCCGLRKNEIDGLEWSAFNFTARTLRIENTEHLHLKSEESAATIGLDPEVSDLFRGWAEEDAGQGFVIRSTGAKRGPRSYRCKAVFNGLVQWLRRQGIADQKPLHALRKEAGSAICERAGIQAASAFLRHRDIAVTSQHYVGRETKETTGFGAFLGRKIAGERIAKE